MPFPWLAVATIASSLLPLLFGKGGAQRTTTTQVPPQGYQSPLLGLMDPLMADILMRRLGASRPGGGAYSPMIGDILQLLGKQWPQLMTGYGRSPGPGTISIPRIGG